MFTHLITVKKENDRRDGSSSHPYHGGSFTVPANDSFFSRDTWNNVLQYGALPSGWSLDSNCGIDHVVKHMKKELGEGKIESIRVTVEYPTFLFPWDVPPRTCTAWVTYAKRGE